MIHFSIDQFCWLLLLSHLVLTGIVLQKPQNHLTRIFFYFLRLFSHEGGHTSSPHRPRPSGSQVTCLGWGRLGWGRRVCSQALYSVCSVRFGIWTVCSASERNSCALLYSPCKAVKLPTRSGLLLKTFFLVFPEASRSVNRILRKSSGRFRLLLRWMIKEWRGHLLR